MRLKIAVAGLLGGLLGAVVASVSLSIGGWGYEWQDSLLGMIGCGVILGVLVATGLLLGRR